MKQEKLKENKEPSNTLNLLSEGSWNNPNSNKAPSEIIDIDETEFTFL